jgi:hypothetical protein
MLYIHKESEAKVQKIEFFKIYKKKNRAIEYIKMFFERNFIYLNKKRHYEYAFRNFFKRSKNKTEYFCFPVKIGKYELIARMYSIKFKKIKQTPQNIELTKKEEEEGFWEDFKIEITYVNSRKKEYNRDLLKRTIEGEFLKMEAEAGLTSLEAEKRCLNSDFLTV